MRRAIPLCGGLHSLTGVNMVNREGACVYVRQCKAQQANPPPELGNRSNFNCETFWSFYASV